MQDDDGYSPWIEPDDGDDDELDERLRDGMAETFAGLIEMLRPRIAVQAANAIALWTDPAMRRRLARDAIRMSYVDKFPPTPLVEAVWDWMKLDIDAAISGEEFQPLDRGRIREICVGLIRNPEIN